MHRALPLLILVSGCSEQGFSSQADSPAGPLTPQSSLVDSPKPTTSDDAYALDEDSVLEVPASQGLLANDHSRGRTLTVSLASPATHGLVELGDDGSFLYTPHADFAGDDAFDYRLSTGETATVTLAVWPVNDAPTAPEVAITPGDPTEFPMPSEVNSVFTMAYEYP